jgi:hypothetical protein
MPHGRSLPTLLAALVLMALTLALAQPERASAAASMSATVTTPDPTGGKAVALQVSGDTGGAVRDLYMYEKPGAATCAATYDANTGGGGTTYAYPATAYNSFSIARSFTPDTGTWTVCFYLATSTSATPDAVAQATFTARSPTATMNVAIDPDPRTNHANWITVSGNLEVGRKIFITWVAGRDCPSADSGADVYSYGIFGSGSYHGAGDYTERTTLLTPAAGHYMICVLVAAGVDSPAEASGSLDVDVRDAHASVSIAMDRSPYQLGAGRRTATVTASSEDTTYLEFSVSTIGSCVQTLDGDDAVVGTTITRTLTLDPGRNPRAAVCAYLFRNRRLVASDTAIISELPVTVPVAVAPKGLIADRRPSFAWSTGAGFTDDLVLSDRDGTTLLLVGADGAWVPSDGTSHGGQQLKRPAAVRKGYDRLPGAATYTNAGGTARVAVQQLLPPGAYRWSVNRTRSDGEAARMAPVSFKIAGPDVKRLSVGARSFPVANSRHPGHSELRITTTPWAYVRIALTRGGRERVQNLRWDGSPTHALSFTWTCRATGGAYGYAITAGDDAGHSFTRKGRIRTISHARCASLRAAERRKVDRRVAQRRRREAAAERRRDAAARAKLQEKIDQCHDIDGVVRAWDWGDGTETLFCVTPYGPLVM